MSELYLISCVSFKCSMWALNPHSSNPAKCINNYAKSIQQLIEVFSVWYGCQQSENLLYSDLCLICWMEKNPFIHHRFIPNTRNQEKVPQMLHTFSLWLQRWLCHLVSCPSLLHPLISVICKSSKKDTNLYNSQVVLYKEIDFFLRLMHR